jgi:acetolactate synthase-1/2/3 large subunit
MSDKQRGADLLVRCLEAAGIEHVFGIPGEENLDFVDALRASPIRFITTRHEQGAAFMADVWGRLTGRPGVCTATLGPGATNLLTAVADAYLDRAPLLAIAGQGATKRLHKRSHQIIDLAGLFTQVTKSSKRIAEPDALAETVIDALQTATRHPPGPCLIELPENIAAEPTAGEPLTLLDEPLPVARSETLNDAAQLLAKAKRPLVLIGNGALRANASRAVAGFVERLNAPFTTTFMAKGTISDDHPLALATTGLSENEHATCGFDRADLVITIGYDLVEYDPQQWHRDPQQAILHIDTVGAETDRHFRPTLSLVGDITDTLQRLADSLPPPTSAPPVDWGRELRAAIRDHQNDLTDADDYPVKPQRLLTDMREVLEPDAVVISDVGAHKVWIAHLWRTLVPNTCIISNGFAAMGIGLPGAIAAKLAFPDRQVITTTGDAGFMMNAQELETALRLKLAIVVLVWNDNGYGLIDWHQRRRFGHTNDVDFGNPDLVAFAESFGARGFRIDSAAALAPTLREALACGTVAVVDCPVDYSENMRLTERLGRLSCID